MKRFITITILFLTLCSCTPRQLRCLLENIEITETYEFAIGKEDIKDIIFNAYTYDLSLLRLNLGAVNITEKSIDEKYRASVENYMFRKDFKQLSRHIRNQMPDTLNIRIGKLQSRKGHDYLVVVEGNNERSRVTIKQMNYSQARECPPEKTVIENGLKKFGRILEI